MHSGRQTRKANSYQPDKRGITLQAKGGNQAHKVSGGDIFPDGWGLILLLAAPVRHVEGESELGKTEQLN